MHVYYTCVLSQVFNGSTGCFQVRLLKVAIEGSTMVVQKQVDVAGDEKSDFAAVDRLLEDDVPCYILFKMDSATKEGWLLANWVPENTKVRQKMLYASSREALKKELGSIAAEITAAERDEITYEAYQGAVVVNEAERLSLMSDKERALKHTANTHVDTGIPTKASYVHGVKFPLSDEARDAIAALKENASLSYVQLRVDKEPSEQIVLDKKETLEAGFDAYKSAVCDTSEPRFSLYVSTAGGSEGAADAVVFCLYCPEDAPVKQKMLYSTAKAALVEVAAELDVSIAVKIEVREPSDLTESDLVPCPAAPDSAPAALPTMARPRGPGSGRGMIKLPGM
jgi:twinfilin-like protein